LQKAIVSLIGSVRPSIRMKEPNVRWKKFHEIWHLNIFRKSIEKIQALLKFDNNNAYFT